MTEKVANKEFSNVSPGIPVDNRDPLIPGQEPSEHSSGVQGLVVASRLPPVNDRLSAVPFSGMVRDQNTPEHFIDSNKDELAATSEPPVLALHFAGCSQRVQLLNTSGLPQNLKM